MTQLNAVKKTVAFLNKKTNNFNPEVLLITGSGMALSIPALKNKIVIPYAKIPNFLRSTVEGHPSNLIFGTYKNKRIVVMQGRFHFYEGYAMKDLAFAIRVAAFLGVKTMIVSAAVGSFNKKLTVGSMCVLSDHINFMATNPLIGNYDEHFGPRFVEMSDVYDKTLRNLALKAAKKHKIKAGEGVYLADSGPNFETPAEVRALRILGADVAGMSTVPEVICARQLGLKVCGLTWVVNMGCGMTKKPICHAKTIAETKKIEGGFKKILEEIIPFC